MLRIVVLLCLRFCAFDAARFKNVAFEEEESSGAGDLTCCCRAGSCSEDEMGDDPVRTMAVQISVRVSSQAQTKRVTVPSPLLPYGAFDLRIPQKAKKCCKFSLGTCDLVAWSEELYVCKQGKPTGAGVRAKISETDYQNAQQAIQDFFGAASERFGALVDYSSPLMVEKILRDYHLLKDERLLDAFARNTNLQTYMSKPVSLQGLKANLAMALQTNEVAFAPVIDAMYTAVQSGWFEYRRQPVSHNAISKCLDSMAVLAAPTSTSVEDWNDVAHCFAAEFVNGLLVMDELNKALLKYDVAEAAHHHFSEVLANMFQVSVEQWKSMPTIPLYRTVQEKLFKGSKERYLVSQFKAMKLVSVMMPFEATHHMMHQEEKFSALQDNPRWKPTYEEFQRAHTGGSNWETMELNIAEANAGDAIIGLGNDVASNSLMEYLKQYGKDVIFDLDDDGVASTSFPLEWIGLYTLWNNLFVMSGSARPLASAILYFPLILNNPATWAAVRTNSLWMFIHEATLTRRKQLYPLPKHMGQAIAKITAKYAKRLNAKYKVTGKYKTPGYKAIASTIGRCIKFFFNTFDPQNKYNGISSIWGLMRHYVGQWMTRDDEPASLSASREMIASLSESARF